MTYRVLKSLVYAGIAYAEGQEVDIIEKSVAENCLERELIAEITDAEVDRTEVTGETDSTEITEDNEDNNETRLYLTEFELQEFALDLLNLVREVIFSLKNAIQISENEKQSTISSEVALIPINYEEVDSEDKL